MLPQFVLTLALAGTTLAAPFLHSPRQSGGCASGVHIIAARGSTEPQGEGPLQNVSALIEQSIPGSDDAAVIYPADLVPYESSEEQGVTNMTQMITSYVQQCPSAKIVLLGYSQGGQIVGDILNGGSYGGTPPIDYNTYSKNIVAAVTFADPAFVIGKPYDKGTATKSGRFARKDTTNMDKWSGVLANWCDDHDFFCASGDSIPVHTSEVQNNGRAAAAFVVGLIRGSQKRAMHV